MEIQITQDHIDRGKVGQPAACAAALALTDAGFSDVRAGGDYVDVTLRDGRKLSYVTLDSFKEFLEDFDEGRALPGLLILSCDTPCGAGAGFTAAA